MHIEDIAQGFLPGPFWPPGSAVRSTSRCPASTLGASSPSAAPGATEGRPRRLEPTSPQPSRRDRSCGTATRPRPGEAVARRRGWTSRPASSSPAWTGTGGPRRRARQSRRETEGTRGAGARGRGQGDLRARGGRVPAGPARRERAARSELACARRGRGGPAPGREGAAGLKATRAGGDRDSSPHPERARPRAALPESPGAPHVRPAERGGTHTT